MARGRQELEWDLSNNIMAQLINTSRNICRTIEAMNGVKNRSQPQPLSFIDMNPYRD